MSDGILDALTDPTVEALKRRIPGVAPAVVTDNQDPGGLGRVKVRYPWLAGNQESYWARIARPYAGADRGDWMPPQINDEVLVAFELGKIDRPCIVGTMWNGVDLPPETSTEKLVRKTRKGYTWETDETDGAEKIGFIAGAWSWILDLVSNTLTFVIGGKARVESGASFAEIDNAGVIKTKAATEWQDTSEKISLAGGGAKIARMGDSVEVNVGGTVYTGAITSGSDKVTAG